MARRDPAAAEFRKRLTLWRAMSGRDIEIRRAVEAEFASATSWRNNR